MEIISIKIYKKKNQNISLFSKKKKKEKRQSNQKKDSPS